MKQSKTTNKYQKPEGMKKKTKRWKSSEKTHCYKVKLFVGSQIAVVKKSYSSENKENGEDICKSSGDNYSKK